LFVTAPNQVLARCIQSGKPREELSSTDSEFCHSQKNTLQVLESTGARHCQRPLHGINHRGDMIILWIVSVDSGLTIYCI